MRPVQGQASRRAAARLGSESESRRDQHGRHGIGASPWSALALLTLVWCCGVRPASADVRTEARQYFRSGMELIQDGRPMEGVEKLQLAYDLLPHPNVLYNIARAYAEYGDYELAIDFYERYLEVDPPDGEEVMSFVAALEARIRERQQGPDSSSKLAPEAAPTAAPTTGARAEAAEIDRIEESAEQLARLAEVTGSPALRERAESLREVASTLRERAAAAGPQTAQPAASEAGTGGDGSAVASAPTSAAPLAPEAGDTKAPTQDLALGSARVSDIYAESVVSASRFAQSPLLAPNSTETITRQDIRLSGLTTVPELLRRVAGIDIIMMWPGDVVLSLRGFNQRLPNKLLILVNGRSINRDYLGAPFLTREPMAVEDIESIEIVRGPASALYGANAVAGVVNILTRSPGTPSTDFTVGGGMGNSLHVHGATAGRVAKRLTYRFAAGQDHTDNFEQSYDPRRVDLSVVDGYDPSLSHANTYLNADLRYRLSADVEASVQAGYADNTQGFAARGPRASFMGKGLTSHVLGLMETSWGQLRAFWNHQTDRAFNIITAPGADPFLSTVNANVMDVDATFSQEIELGLPQNIHVGANYRRKDIAWDWFNEDYTEHHWAAYLQDTVTATDWLSLVGSLRVDGHPLLDAPVFSPRGAAVFRLTPFESLRASVGSAFRTPTFAETYQDVTLSVTPALSILSRGSELSGGEPLKPEEIISFELGYLSTRYDWLKLEANAYYNRLTNRTTATPAIATRLSNLSDGPYDTVTNSFGLSRAFSASYPGTYQIFGTELQGRFYLLSGLDLYLNYAFNKTLIPTLVNAEFPNGPDDSKRTAEHKFNTGVQYRSPIGLDLNLDFHAVTDTEWVLSLADQSSTTLTTPSYFMGNARLGYRLADDRLELAIVASNFTDFLIDNKHRQHPYGQLIAGRASATAALHF